MAAWQEDICNETSGFLFKHECYQLPRAKCQRCGKPICEEHSHELADGTFCTACARIQIQPGATGSDRPRTDDRDDWRRDESPYLYGSSHYYGYHSGPRHHQGGRQAHDPNDFTGGDGGSFQTEGNESFESSGGSFERDMGES